MSLGDFLDATYALLAENRSVAELHDLFQQAEAPAAPRQAAPGRGVARTEVAAQNQSSMQQLEAMMSGVKGKKPLMGRH